MTSIYILLGSLAALLFGIAITIGILQRKSKQDVLFNTNTKTIEILEDEPKVPRTIEKPMIISSTLLEENLEDNEEDS